MTPRPEWLIKLLPAELPEPPDEETCLDIHPAVFRRLGMRPRHHWDHSPRIDGNKHFCLRCDLKRCQVVMPGSGRQATPQCERHSRHRKPHQTFREDGRVQKAW